MPKKYQPKISKNVGLDDDSQEKLVTLTQSSKWNKKTLVKYLINLCMEFRFDKDGWKVRLNEALEKVNVDNFKFLSDCPAVAVGKDSKGKFIYRCVWSKKAQGRPPDIKVLGDTESLANSACTGCNRTESILKGIDDYVKQIAELRKEVSQGAIVKVPSCIHGGQLSDDGKKLYCKDKDLSAQYRDVHKHCKVLRNGANCKSLRWTTIHAKGKFADPKK